MTTPRLNKRTNRITYNVWEYARPWIPFGVENFGDGVSDGKVFLIEFNSPLTFLEYTYIESWIDDHLTSGIFYLTKSKVYFSDVQSALTFKMMYAMPNDLLDY